MNFFEKYPILKQQEYLSKTLVETVSSTMSLEGQEVSKQTVQKIVSSLLKDTKLIRS